MEKDDIKHNIFDGIKETVERNGVSIDQAIERLNTLDAQVQFCVDLMDEKGILEEHCLTFPDGETVYATQTLEG